MAFAELGMCNQFLWHGTVPTFCHARDTHLCKKPLSWRAHLGRVGHGVRRRSKTESQRAWNGYQGARITGLTDDVE